MSMSTVTRNISLDVLRSIAILQVLIYHFFYRWSDYTGFSVTLFNRQWLGVNLFFILSGYLIYNSMIRSKSRGLFVKKRFRRIIPAYYLTIAIIGVVFFVGQYTVDYSGWNEGNFYQSAFFNALFLPEGILEGYFYLDGVFWSLIVEVQFYILCSVFWNRTGFIKYTLILLTLWAYLVPGYIDKFFPLARYGAWFLFGISIREKSSLFTLVACVLCLGSFYDDIFSLLSALAIIVLFYWFEKQELKQEYLWSKYLAFYSYEIYLIHQTVMFISLERFDRSSFFLISSLVFTVLTAICISRMSTYLLKILKM